MEAIFIILNIWLQLCQASDYETTDSSNITECYNCRGVVGEVTNCGESMTLEHLEEVDTIPCDDGVCTKAVRYNMDQKIYVTRNCSDTCDPGCGMRAGSGTCWYCCYGDLCNSANIPKLAITTILFPAIFTLIIRI